MKKKFAIWVGGTTLLEREVVNYGQTGEVIEAPSDIKKIGGLLFRPHGSKNYYMAVPSEICITNP